MNPFEFAMRLFFGDKAYHISDESMNPSRRSFWLKRALRQVTKDFAYLETSAEHRHLLLLAVEDAQKYLPTAKEETPTWGLVYNLLAIIAYLLGYQLMLGRKYCSAIWHQTPGQYFGRKMHMGQSCAGMYQERRSAIATRAEVAEELRAKGLNDFQISLVLNTTDHEIRKLKTFPLKHSLAASLEAKKQQQPPV